MRDDCAEARILMRLDARTKQIIQMFSDPNAYSPLMAYDEIFLTDAKTLAKAYYERVKKYEHVVQKRKYFDSMENETYEAWFISIKLKHSIIDAFFYPFSNKSRVIILRKDKPYITFAIGGAIIIAIILFGSLIIKMSLDFYHLMRTFLESSALVGGTIYLCEKLTLPDEVRNIIRDFDAEFTPFKEHRIDEKELSSPGEMTEAEKELTEEDVETVAEKELEEMESEKTGKRTRKGIMLDE